MSDYSWIGPVAAEVGKGINSYQAGDKANAQMQEAYRQMLANLQARFSDYDKLGSAGYQDVTAQQVGPSALGGIQYDPAARQAQQESISKLSELAANGGLSLADMKALNDIQGNLSRNNSARQQGLANQFAARGQLGSGAQLAMGLQGQSDAAMQANNAGESAAAQAQARALQAIIQKGQMAGNMADSDYARKADAAKAADMIAARNAAARTDASKTNNAYRGQAYDDALRQAQGKTSLTNSMNNAVFGQGKQSANTTLGQASAVNSGIGAAGGLFGGGKSSGGGSSSGGSSGSSGSDTSSDTDSNGSGEDDSWNNGDENDL